MAQGTQSNRLTHEEFINVAIEGLADPKYGKGIHVVYSNFNAAFEEYFGTPARPIVDKLSEEGKFIKRWAKGGVMLYKPEDAPEVTDNRGSAALAKLGLVQ